MSWRLTPEERRIIERTRREGEEAQKALEGETTSKTGNSGKVGASAPAPLWRSVLIWIVGIVIMVVLAMLMVWVGSLVR